MSFRAPVRDLAFALSTVGHDALIARAYPELDADTVAAVLDAAGTFATDVLAPLNRIGDQNGIKLKDGKVTTAPGWPDAYRRWSEAGWHETENLTGREVRALIVEVKSSQPIGR